MIELKNLTKKFDELTVLYLCFSEFHCSDIIMAGYDDIIMCCIVLSIDRFLNCFTLFHAYTVS